MRPRALLSPFLLIVALGAGCPYSPCACQPPYGEVVLRGRITAGGTGFAGATVQGDVRGACTPSAIVVTLINSDTTGPDGSWLIERASYAPDDSGCVRVWALRSGFPVDSLTAERMVLFRTSLPFDTVTINLAFP